MVRRPNGCAVSPARDATDHSRRGISASVAAVPATPLPTLPDYSGGSLVNLVAELERRLTGAASSPGLRASLGTAIADAATYVLVLFDGLGSAQLEHPAAGMLAADRAASIDAPFPTTTTVSLASIATGLPPSQHGLLGYQLWMPQVGEVVNTIKWTTLWGAALDFDTEGMLPSPNLWERLNRAGLEPITVQPAGFAGSKLTKLLYRGCRFEGVATVEEQIAATCQLAAVPGRLILTYVPQVDFAAHVAGQSSPEYAQAMATADFVWSSLRSRLPQGVGLVGTADHGHMDFPKERQHRIPRALHRGRTFYGDSRVMFVRGDGAEITAALPATWHPFPAVAGWWGPEPFHTAFDARRPDGLLVPERGHVLLHKHSDDRMTGHHGGLEDAERLVPLLVAR